MVGQSWRACTVSLYVERPPVIDPRIVEAEPLLRPPTEGQAIVADYGSLGLTLRRHPLALLRPRFERLGFETAAGVQRLAHGDSVRTAGLVIMRQRPGTATGVVFVTLEDETGYVNLIVWSSLVEEQRKELLGSRLLGVLERCNAKAESFTCWPAHSKTTRDFSAVWPRSPEISIDASSGGKHRLP